MGLIGIADALIGGAKPKKPEPAEVGLTGGADSPAGGARPKNPNRRKQKGRRK